MHAHAVLAVSTNNLRGNTYIRTQEIICATFASDELIDGLINGL